jgi:hypothetical protein
MPFSTRKSRSFSNRLFMRAMSLGLKSKRVIPCWNLKQRCKILKSSKLRNFALSLNYLRLPLRISWTLLALCANRGVRSNENGADSSLNQLGSSPFNSNRNSRWVSSLGIKWLSWLYITNCSFGSHRYLISNKLKGSSKKLDPGSSLIVSRTPTTDFLDSSSSLTR